MLTKNKFRLVFLLIIISLAAYGQHNNFTHRRPIGPIEQEGWHSVVLPLDIFQHVKKDYSDLRILSVSGGDTTEIPYLLNVKTDVVAEEEFNLPIFNQSKSGKKLFFTVQIPDEKKVNTLYLNFEEKNFNGYVSIEGSDDRRQWFEVGKAQRILSIHTHTVDYHATTLSFPLSAYTYLRINVEADIPLSLERTYFKNIATQEGVLKKVSVKQKVLNEKQLTSIIFKFKYPVPVNRVVIKAQHNTDYYRSYYLQSVSDSVESPKGWIKQYTTLKRGYLTSLKPNEITFEPTLAHEFKLTIDNQDNPPVTIDDVEVYTPEVELMANLQPGDLFLFYGNPKLSKPNYDLVHFEDKIPVERNVATLLAQETIEQKPKPKPLFTDHLWLWGIMVLVIGVLGYFTLRMLSSKG
jgi:hypothetical protein